MSNSSKKTDPLESEDDNHISIHKIYGRDSQLIALTNFLNKFLISTDKSDGIIFISGPSGIGKTSLVELFKPLALKENAIFISGKFNQYEQSSPFNGIFTVIENLCQILLATDRKYLEKIKTDIKEILGANLEVLLSVIPALTKLFEEVKPSHIIESSYNENNFKYIFCNFISCFGKQNSPLIIFLDDLQWADTGSLQLLEYLTLNFNISNTLLINSYRSEEAANNSSLVSTLNRIQSSSLQNILNIELKPLEITHINEIVYDILKKEPAKELSDLILSKTAGNPFYIKELLKTLNKKRMIYRNRHTSGWEWDITNVDDIPIHTNLLDLMLYRISTLPVFTQNILQKAACIGNNFDLSTLLNLIEDDIKTIHTIAEIIQEGYFIPINHEFNFEELKIHISDIKKFSYKKNYQYKFFHDKLQQAAYLSIEESNRKKIHYSIARIWLEDLHEEEKEEDLFNIITQVNQGISFFKEKDSFIAIDLNLSASEKAHTLASYFLALDFANNAINIFDKVNLDPVHNYDLYFKIEKRRAEANFMISNFNRCKIILLELVSISNNSIHRAQAYSLLIITYSAENDFQKGLAAIRSILKELGEPLPDSNYLEHSKKEFLKIKKLIGNRKIEDLVNNDLVNIPEKEWAMHILSNSITPTYNTDIDLCNLVSIRMVLLYLTYGNLTDSYGYATLSLYLAKQNKFQESYEFASLAIEISKKYDNKYALSRSTNILANYASPWVRHLRETDNINSRGLKGAIEAGEFLHSGYIVLHMGINSFYCGTNLVELFDKTKDLFSHAKRIANTLAIDILIGLYITIHSLNKDLAPKDLIAEKAYLTLCEEHNSFYTLIIYKIMKLQVLYMLDKSEELEPLIDEINASFVFISGINSTAEFYTYESIILISKLTNHSSETKTKKIEKIKKNLKSLKTFSDSSSANYFHKYLIVKGYYSLFKGEIEEGIFDLKIGSELARENGFTQYYAIASEILGNFYLEKRMLDSAKRYLDEAYFTYERWGASSKLEQLKKKYANKVSFDTKTHQELSRISNNEDLRITITNRNKNFYDIDFSSFLKTNAAIQEEIILEKLVEKVLKITVQNAGAEYGVIILKDGQKYYVEAAYQSSLDEIKIIDPLPIEHYSKIPLKVINYVVHSKDFLVLNNASEDETFNQDPYIKENKSKSILCVPLLKKSEPIGIIYLENSLSSNIFTENRIQITKLLFSQAAISLENARLYANLQIETEEKSRIQTEMRVAEKIQKSLIPSRPSMHGYQVATYMKPADKVGGDYFDIINTPGSDYIIIADVSGHGLTAGLIMMMVQTSIHSTLQAGGDLKPSELLSNVNKTITSNISKLGEMKYVTITALNAKSDGFITYSGCHLELLIYRINTGAIEVIKTKGHWLGIEDNIEDFLTDADFTLNTGDKLLLFTDGITEAMGIGEETYGKNRLVDLFGLNAHKSPDEIKNAILKSVELYKVLDDISLLVIEKT